MSNENAVAKSAKDQEYASLWLFGENLAKSELVPDHYQGKPANCFIAVDFARHMGLPVLAVMRGTHTVKGKLGFAAEFVIAQINSSGKFDEPLNYEEEGDLKDGTYRVRCTAPIKGKVFRGPWVSWDLVKAEGWNSSKKYQSMPEVMMAYRAATFFGRRFAPETLYGAQTVEELEDMDAAGVLEAPRDIQAEANVDAAMERLDSLSAPVTVQEVVEEATAKVDAFPENGEPDDDLFGEGGAK